MGNRTVGNITTAIETGESFDLVIASPAELTGRQIRQLEGGIDLAKVGVGWRYGKALPSPHRSGGCFQQRCWRQRALLMRSGRGGKQ